MGEGKKEEGRKEWDQRKLCSSIKTIKIKQYLDAQILNWFYFWFSFMKTINDQFSFMQIMDDWLSFMQTVGDQLTFKQTDNLLA